MAKSLRLILMYLRHNLMSALAYRVAFMIQIVGMMLNNVMLLFFWTVLFNRLPTLNGWGLEGVITIYAIVAFGYGVAVVVFGNTFHVAEVIAKGDLDYYLALPADPLTHLLVSRMSIAGWGDLFFGLLIYCIALPAAWRHLPLFLFLGVLSGLVFVAFNVLVGSLVFWLGQAQNLSSQLGNALLTFSLYPIDIFPGVVRVLLYVLIPAAFVGSIPAKLLMEFNTFQLLELTIFVIVLCYVARLLFMFGLRRYESGNLVTARG